MSTFIALMQIYNGSDGEATKALFARLEERGPAGQVAINLFRAHKSSSRAKVYRGRGYRDAAYDRKQWSLDNLVGILTEHADALDIRWGWKEDPKQSFHKWVIYVDLPTGQVSFHTAARSNGPDYSGGWDGSREQGPTRICQFVQRVLEPIAISSSLTPAAAAFRAAYFAAVRRYRAMSSKDFGSAVIGLCADGGGVDDDQVVAVLSRLAGEGSIDAAAMIMVFSDADPSLDELAVAALTAVIRRSADIHDELVTTSLVAMMEEQMEEWERQGFAERVGINEKGNTIWRFTRAGNAMLKSSRGEIGGGS